MSKVITDWVLYQLKNGMIGKYRRKGKCLEIWLGQVVNNPPAASEVLPSDYLFLKNEHLTCDYYPSGTYYSFYNPYWESSLDSSACPTTRNPIADNGVAQSSCQEVNKAILNLISKAVIKYPKLQFWEILTILTIAFDDEELESANLLKRVLKAYKELEK